jgi:hypothetical protein
MKRHCVPILYQKEKPPPGPKGLRRLKKKKKNSSAMWSLFLVFWRISSRGAFRRIGQGSPKPLKPPRILSGARKARN